MKKIIASILICIMMLFSFAACNDNNNEHENLTGLGSFEGLDPKVELQIIKDCLGESYKGQESVDNNPIKYYYGKYNNYIVVKMLIGWSLGPRTEEIEGIEFNYPNLIMICVWKNNKLYGLPKASGEGWLTKQNIGEINTIDRQAFPSMYLE